MAVVPRANKIPFERDLELMGRGLYLDGGRWVQAPAHPVLWLASTLHISQDCFEDKVKCYEGVL